MSRWYVATIDGREKEFSRLLGKCRFLIWNVPNISSIFSLFMLVHFVHVADALRAYDVYTVSHKGALTSRVDLNLPEEWAFPNPEGICEPVHLNGYSHQSEHSNRRHNKNARKKKSQHSENKAPPSAQCKSPSEFHLEQQCRM